MSGEEIAAFAVGAAYPFVLIFYGKFLRDVWYFIKDSIIAIPTTPPRSYLERSLRRITGRRRPDYARIAELEQMEYQARNR